MLYKEWFDAHAAKHQRIVAKLIEKGYGESEIIHYFRWENLKEAERDFCPLFKENLKCHEVDDLNCYLCACPHFRFDDDAVKYKSRCSIEAKNGASVEINGAIHHDCSGCVLPHQESFIRKCYDNSWLEVMSKVH